MKGGYRQGAGRKKGFAAKTAEEARVLLAGMLMREISPIGEALIAKAKRGDIGAAKELFDRAWGRAPQGIDLTTQGEKIGPDDKIPQSKVAYMMAALEETLRLTECEGVDPDIAMQRFQEWHRTRPC